MKRPQGLGNGVLWRWQAFRDRSLTVFIANACAKTRVDKIYAIDLFTPSWGTKVNYFADASARSSHADSI